MDPLKLECGDVCDVEVVLVMKDGSTKSGLAIGGGGGKISLLFHEEGLKRGEQVPVEDVMTAHRIRRS